MEMLHLVKVNHTFSLHSLLLVSLATTCADLMDIDNGYVAYASGAATPRPFGDVASYVCDTGYSPSHTTSRVCGGDGLDPIGVWSGTVATCSSEFSSRSQISSSFISSHKNWLR